MKQLSLEQQTETAQEIRDLHYLMSADYAFSGGDMTHFDKNRDRYFHLCANYPNLTSWALSHNDEIPPYILEEDYPDTLDFDEHFSEEEVMRAKELLSERRRNLSRAKNRLR